MKSTTPYTISVSNQKGGVGKSTTSLCIADAFRNSGKKVLLIDLDPQCNCTNTYRAVTENTNTMYDVLFKNCSLSDAIQHTETGDIVPCDEGLGGIEAQFYGNMANYAIIRDGIDLLKDYQLVIIDTPPNLGFYSTCAWMGSDGIIIPVPGSKYAIDGLTKAVQNIRESSRYNSNLKILGVLQTMYDARKDIDRRVKEELPSFGKRLELNIFKTVIRVSQEVQKAQDERTSLFKAYPKCKAAQDYQELIGEILREARKK